MSAKPSPVKQDLQKMPAASADPNSGKLGPATAASQDPPKASAAAAVGDAAHAQKVASAAAEDALKKLAAAPPAEVRKCCQCERDNVQEGRFHGKKWYCTSCNTLTQLLRRHLGSAELEGFNQQERAAFFRYQHESASTDGRYTWQCVRSSLLKTKAEKKIEAEERRMSAEELPLSVWLSRGFDKSVVLACPCRKDTLLGDVYAVPIRKQINREINETVEKELLTKEHAVRDKEASKKRKTPATGAQNEWDVAEPGSQPPLCLKGPSKACKAQKTTKERTEAALQKQQAKAEKVNGQQAALAAKGVGSLSGSLRQVNIVSAQCDKILPDSLEQQRESLNEAKDKLQLWLQESTDFLQVHEKTKGTGNMLKALSYSGQDLKDLTKATAGLVKEIRTYLNEEKARQAEALEQAAEKATEAGKDGTPPVSGGKGGGKAAGKKAKAAKAKASPKKKSK